MAKLTLEEMWERMLTGNVPRLHKMRRMWGALPSPPRCKLCNAPFRGPGGVLMRAIAYGPSPLNRRLCKWCIRAVHKHPGGAEVEISVLFADVRGSTAIAERILPEEFSRLMARFYGAVAGVIDEWDGPRRRPESTALARRCQSARVCPVRLQSRLPHGRSRRSRG